MTDLENWRQIGTLMGCKGDAIFVGHSIKCPHKATNLLTLHLDELCVYKVVKYVLKHDHQGRIKYTIIAKKDIPDAVIKHHFRSKRIRVMGKINKNDNWFTSVQHVDTATCYRCGPKLCEQQYSISLLSQYSLKGKDIKFAHRGVLGLVDLVQDNSGYVYFVDTACVCF